MSNPIWCCIRSGIWYYITPWGGIQYYAIQIGRSRWQLVALHQKINISKPSFKVCKSAVAKLEVLENLKADDKQRRLW